MLTGVLGLRLILLMGQTVPLPVPLAVSAAFTRLEVTSDAQGQDGFQITFVLGRDTVVDYSLLQSGLVETFNRVIIGVLLGAVPQVLIDGVITHHQLAPSPEPGRTSLTITGRDVSQMLDLEEKNEKFDNQPDFLIALRLLGQYAQYGLVPQITPTSDVPIMLQRIPRQHETDLKFIQRLAERNGFVFYIEPLSLGVNTAYWGPENRLGLPQPALSLNMGASTNVNSLNFALDALAPVSTGATVIEPISKVNIPIPSLPSLRIPPLVSSPAPARRKILLRDAADQNPGQAATNSIATVSRAPDAVQAEGELDGVAYGSVLRARHLVGVRGVGLSYDGNYYVRRVTHSLENGKYSQRFTLSREGTGALLPVVAP
jgi:hypothetical protein